MPTYQYACTECGEALEVVQKFSDEPLTVCPTCQGRLRKVFSAVGVVFKGSGFYKNDSRAKTSASTSKSDSADAKSSDSKSETKTETKTETKSETKTESKSDSKTGGDSSKVA
jgi:putative FmdB family regulatory protein